MVVPCRVAPSIIAATSDVEHEISWEWMASTQLENLVEHRVQADVARHRLHQRQHRLLAGAVVGHLGRDQRP